MLRKRNMDNKEKKVINRITASEWNSGEASARCVKWDHMKNCILDELNINNTLFRIIRRNRRTMWTEWIQEETKNKLYVIRQEDKNKSDIQQRDESKIGDCNRPPDVIFNCNNDNDDDDDIV
jgi:hypothetical protein